METTIHMVNKMKKLILILFMLTIFPGLLFAKGEPVSKIGHIELDQLFWEKKLDHQQYENFLVTTFLYPDATIKIVQVFWALHEDHVDILLTRYLKDGDLYIWKLSENEKKYERTYPPTPDAKLKVLKDLIAFHKYLVRLQKKTR